MAEISTHFRDIIWANRLRAGFVDLRLADAIYEAQWQIADALYTAAIEESPYCVYEARGR